MKPSQAHNNESKFLMTVSSTGLSLAKRSKAPSLVEVYLRRQIPIYPRPYLNKADRRELARDLVPLDNLPLRRRAYRDRRRGSCLR